MGIDKININSIYKQNSEFILDVKNYSIYLNKVNVILGENGAGKSTLLKEIVENNIELVDYKKIMLTQSTFVFSKSCEKSVEMVLRWNNSKESAFEYLDKVGLLNKKSISGKKLSGGEKKRLAFSMALAKNADIILLDEPFANIDKKNQQKLIKIIKDLKDEKTIILVSHRENICREIGDYFIEIEDGKLVKSD